MDHRTILLVEDNPNDVELTVRALRKSNITNSIVTVPDGPAALDYLFHTGPQAGQPPAALPVVVLLDLKLPKLDGLQVLERIRANERTRLLPVVILTSSDDEIDRMNGYRLGANSYIRKPVEFSRFSEAIRQLGLYWLILNEPPPVQE